MRTLLRRSAGCVAAPLLRPAPAYQRRWAADATVLNETAVVASAREVLAHGKEIPLQQLCDTVLAEGIPGVDSHEAIVRVLKHCGRQFRVENIRGVQHVRIGATPFAPAPSVAPAPEYMSLTSEARPTQLLALQHQASTTYERLQPYLPSSFFIPLPVAYDALPPHLQASMAGHYGGGPQGMLAALHDTRSGELDVRVLGDAADDVFVRAVGEHQVCILEKEPGDELHAAYAVAHLAEPLFQALATAGVVQVDKIPELLGQELRDALPLQGPASILVFDRLQCAFDVNTTAYTVQARQDGGSSDLGFTLMATPVPRALRYILTNLTQPVEQHDLEGQLPPEVLLPIQQCFGGLSQFIAAHPVYLFLRDSEVWSTSLHQELNFNKRRQDDPFDADWLRWAGQEIASKLPPDRATTWKAICHAVDPAVATKVGKRPRGFFDRFPGVIACYDIIGSRDFVLQHGHLPPPRNAFPHVACEYDLLRVVAMACVQPTHSTDLALPHRVNTLLVRHNGVQAWLSRYPKWFHVDEDGFVTYVGHQCEE